MQSIFRLVEDHRLRPVEHGICDLCIAMSWQAVHEDGIRLGVCHKSLVDLIGLENGGTLCCLMLKAHAGADISVDGVSSCHCLDGVVQEGDAAACGLSDLDCLMNDFKFRSEALGRSHAAMSAELRRSQHERMTNIVAIANVGEPQSFCGTEAFFQSEEVSNGLAGMFEVRESIDQWNFGTSGHLRDGLMSIGAQHDDVHPTLEVASHVGQ